MTVILTNVRSRSGTLARTEAGIFPRPGVDPAMRDRTLITTGAIGAVLAAICCMTPLLVVVFGAVGQGREPSVDLDVADLGRFCRAVPNARMGHLDSRWLASNAKRSSTDRSGSLGTGDKIHMSIAPPTIDIQGRKSWLL